jgi:hypothetical protein
MKTRLTLCLLTSVGLIVSGCGESDDDGLGGLPQGDAPALPEMVTQADFIQGDANTVQWTDGEGKTAAEYLAQRASDAEFTADVVNSGWITTMSFEFTDLQDGTTYHYRVKARNSSGIESDFSVSVSATQDASAPTSAVTDPGPEQTSRRFDVPFDADDTTSGVATIDLWYRRDGGQWMMFGSFQNSPIRFTAPEYVSNYEFYTVAHDAVGNVEDKAPVAEGATQTPEAIILTDNTGMDWDITHAVLQYNMHLNGWGNGLGPDVIRPIIDPDLLGPGDPTYPDDTEVFVVLGVEIDGEARAYRLNDMFDTEVVDDTFGEAYVAVTY